MLGTMRRRIFFGGALGTVGVSVGIVVLLVAPGGLASGLLPGIQALGPKAPPSCSVGSNPGFPAYDPADGYIYVPNMNSANVTVVKSPCTVVATIALPTNAEPTEAAFDPQDNYVYVTDPALSQVYVLSGKVLLATLNGPLFSSPLGITYDPAGAGMLVTNQGTYNVTLIIGTDEFDNVVSLLQQPGAIGIDPVFLNSIEVALPDADEFEAMSPNYPFYGSPTSFNFFGTGSRPAQMAYDPTLPGMYITNPYSNNVTVFVSAGPFEDNVNVGAQPEGLCYSTSDQDMYVMNFDSNSVSEINPSLSVTHTVKLGSGVSPYGCAYDGATGKVYVTGYHSDLIYVLS